MSTSSSPPSSSVYLGLINSPSTQVRDSLTGFLLSNPHCTRLDAGPDSDIKVILRRDWDPTRQVALISGGGDGHAPAHVGFVGEGMLTAAVSGEVFASPSVQAVAAAIRAVAQKQGRHKQEAEAQSTAAGQTSSSPSPLGALLLVKNYTGDRLNFSIALMQCRLALNMPLEMVIIGDDVTLPRSKGVTGRRGVAGTVLVHKIAGAAAAEGLPLSEVAARAQEAADSCVSIGVATSACHVPGNTPDPTRLPLGQMELGMGIHNEQGVRQLPLAPAHEVVRMMVDQMLSRDREQDYFWRSEAEDEARPIRPGQEIVLMVNNLGGATAAELNVFTHEAVTYLQAAPYKFAIRRLLVGSFMTALDMKGISLTIMRLSDDPARAQWQLDALDRPTEASGWPASITKDPVMPQFIPVQVEQEEEEDASAAPAPASASSTAATLPSLFSALADCILSNASHLNALDARSGDGDCGSTLSIGARAVQKLVAEGKLQVGLPLSKLLQRLAKHMGESMGGTSGGIVQILLTAAAAHAQQAEQQQSTSSSALLLAEALSSGQSAVTRFGGASVGDRTMLDALSPALQAFTQALTAAPADTSAALAAAAEAARKGADSTCNMASRAGRSNYVSGEALSQQDPGAEAVALLWQAAAAHTQKA